MVALYIVCVVLYYLFGYLFLPDSICGTAVYILGAFVFPFILLIVVGIIMKLTGYEPPPKPEREKKPKQEDQPQERPTAVISAPMVRQVEQKPQTPDEVLLDVDKMDGRGFELWCVGILRNVGFSRVNATPQSGDQGVDITAEKDGIKYAIQCKCYSSNLGNHPIQEVYAGKTLYGCTIGVVMTNSFFTSGAKELAKSTGTLLWDRDRLRSMLREAGQGEKKIF